MDGGDLTWFIYKLLYKFKDKGGCVGLVSNSWYCFAVDSEAHLDEGAGTIENSLLDLEKHLDKGGEAIENSAGGEVASCDGDAVLEPYEGMEFESEDAAKAFYDEYARRVGFVMRVMSCRRSEVDGRILARRFGCNKEGFCVSIRGKLGPARKPRPSTREGCRAMILVKTEKSGKWIVTRFVRDHNHPLVVAPRECRQTMDEKDKKIQELALELRRKKKLCAAYREKLLMFVKDVEDHTEQLSTKIQVMVNSVREIESADQELSCFR